MIMSRSVNFTRRSQTLHGNCKSLYFTNTLYKLYVILIHLNSEGFEASLHFQIYLLTAAAFGGYKIFFILHINKTKCIIKWFALQAL